MGVQRLLGMPMKIWYNIRMSFDAAVTANTHRQPPSVALIIGAGHAAAMLIRRLHKDTDTFSIVGILDGNGSPQKEIEGVPVLGKLNKLTEALWDYRVTDVIQCGNMEQSCNIQAICHQFSVRYLLHPAAVGFEAGASLHVTAQNLLSADIDRQA